MQLQIYLKRKHSYLDCGLTRSESPLHKLWILPLTEITDDPLFIQKNIYKKNGIELVLNC